MKIFCISLFFMLASVSIQAKELTPEALYESFNMRSIFSSYGQRLKYYCESYPKDYFKSTEMKVSEDNKSIHLESGADIWVIEILGPDKVGVTNAITEGTYRSYKEYAVTYDSEMKDWRASETFIEIPEGCVAYGARG